MTDHVSPDSDRENLEDELFTSPKSTHTNVQSSKGMKVSRGRKKSGNGENYHNIGSSRFIKDRENEEFGKEHNFEEFKAEEMQTVTVDLDVSVSSVEVSEDEEEDWGKLRRHKKLSHGTPCSSCSLMFVDEADLTKHSSEYHSKRKN